MDGNHGEIHPRGADFVASGVPFITAADLRYGRIDIQGCAFISEGQAKLLRKGFARLGDVLLTHKATIGRTAIVDAIPHGLDYIMLTPQVTYYRVLQRDILDPRYLKYYFDSHEFQTLLEAWSGGGSTRAYIGITKQLDLPVRLLAIHTQRAIAGVLGALDDKIEQSRQTAQALERLATSVFRAWFIDFEPVKAKVKGAKSFPSMPQSVFDSLPTRFEDSGLGVVPECWKPGPINALANLSKSQVTPRDSAHEIFDHFSIPAFDAGRRAAQESGETIKSNKFLVVDGCVLLSKLNPRTPRVWLPPPSRGRRQIASTEFLVLVPELSFDRHYLYCQFR
jgi:type I restriction enzyme S subunit